MPTVHLSISNRANTHFNYNKSNNMKRKLLTALSISLVALFFTSCTKEDNIEFDQSLLIGKWKSGTVYERYDSDNSGATWDTSDDVTEEEAQVFTWTLVKDQLEQIHIIQNGGNVPKTYVVTTLTASTLKYEDSVTGVEKTFNKQN